MSVTYKVQHVQYGEAITPVTGQTTINGIDYGIALTVEKVTEEDGTRHAESVVMTLTLDEASEMSRTISDAVATARFKQFISKVKKVMP